MHVTTNQFSDKIDNGWNFFLMADLLWFLGTLTLFFMYPPQICYACYYSDQFSDKFNNGLNKF